MEHNKKILILTIIGVLLLVTIGVGVTAAFYSTGDKQTGLNSFSSGCLNINIENESNSITLNNVYPKTDIEGLDTEGYTFTIRNTCSTSANYQINLESLNEISNTLLPDYIKVSLSSDTNANIITKLKNNTSITPSITNAYEAHNLYTGSIAGNTTKTFNLKLWLDYDATKEQAASKTFTSKINVIANPELTPDTTPEVTFTNSGTTVTGSTNATSVKYCVSSDNICTPTTTITPSNNKFQAVVPEKETKQMVCVSLNSGKTICSNGIKTLITASEYLIAKNEMVNENGYRYEGATPNNYVTFNNEVWRIIGVFDVENTDTGKTESLVKIIRNESIGSIEWDSNNKNDWSQSDIKEILNGQYYNGEDINYVYKKTGKKTLTISGVSLDNTSRDMIQSVKWNLGATLDAEITASEFYSAERGTIGSKDNPTLTTWNGYIGLMYPSDYGYAAASTFCSRSTLLNSYEITNCRNNNWLFNNNRQWLITSSTEYYSFSVSNYFDIDENVDENGILDSGYNNTNPFSTRPTIYLKLNVSILDNEKDGSESKPYDLRFDKPEIPEGEDNEQAELF